MQQSPIKNGLTEQTFRYISPLLSLVAGLFIVAMPLPGISQNSHLFPVLLSCLIFYWTLKRPEYFPSVWVFFAGIMTDIFTGAPLGFWAFCYLVLYALTLYTSRFSSHLQHVFIWISYILISLIMCLTAWLVSSAYLVSMQSLIPYLVAWGWSLVLFPIIALFLAQL